MRKKTSYLSLAIALICILSFSMNAFAATPEMSNADKAEQARQIEMADQKPVVGDIKDNSSLRSVGIYPTRNGVILVTADAWKGLIPTGHAGIIWDGKKGLIIESLSDGVQTGPNNWNKTKKTCYAVGVKKTSEDQDNSASNWCANQRGKKYNFNYFNTSTRKTFYCSQLVWASFLDNYGIDMNTSAYGGAVHPMELVNTPETDLIYQK